MKHTIMGFVRAVGAVMAMVTAVLLFTGATSWEGVSSVDEAIPGTYCVATNSYPRNSVVDITNLENNQMVRVRVVSGLETTGLLAALSPSAAKAIGLNANYTCRIRMTQPPDDIAFSNYRLGPIVTSDESDAPAGLADVSDGNETIGDDTAAAPVPASDENLVLVPVETAAESIEAAEPAAVTELEPAVSEDTMAAAEPVPVLEPMAPPLEAMALPGDTRADTAVDMAANTVIIPDNPVLVSTDEKLPEAADQPALPPENFVPSIAAADAVDEKKSDNITAASTEYIPAVNFSPFQAPLIENLEQGKYYVQVAAFTRVEHAEDEIIRIGTAYPAAIQNVGTDTKPMFRVLLGPLNQGEGGAMLQRLQSIGYKDAFMRHN